MKHIKNKSIIIVARQAGTANAFLPLFEQFRESNFNVKTFAFIHAHTIFSNRNIDSTLIERFDDSVFSSIPQPSMLLSGTSEFAEEDNLFWQWAKSKGIPALAFVDSWVSYWQRFTPSKLGHDRFSCTPDFIAVIDPFMFNRMVEYGCDHNLLIITGNPAFDSLLNYVPKDRENIRRKYGKDYFLFIGEPYNNRVFGGNEKEVLGYTEAEVLMLTANALEILEGQKLKLVFRPHPRGGHSSETHEIIDHHTTIVQDTGEFTSHDLVSCSKAVFGMTSMLLYEASVMGLPVISIQPNGKLSSDLISCCHTIPVVTETGAEHLCSEIKTMLSVNLERPDIQKSTLCDVIRSIVYKQ